jgi:hypothetical protein
MAASSARKAAPGRLEQLRDGSKRLARRSGSFLGGILILLFAAFALVALLTYHQSDPSLNTSAGGPVANWAGGIGAWLSDILLTLCGPPVGLFLPLLMIIGIRLVRGVEPGRWLRNLLITFAGIALIGLAAGMFAGGELWGLPAGWGGGLGLALARGMEALTRVRRACVAQPLSAPASFAPREMLIRQVIRARTCVLLRYCKGFTNRTPLRTRSLPCGGQIATSHPKPSWVYLQLL